MKLLGRLHVQNAIPTKAITAMTLPQVRERFANQSLISITPLGASFEQTLSVLVLHDKTVYETFQLLDRVRFG